MFTAGKVVPLFEKLPAPQLNKSFVKKSLKNRGKSEKPSFLLLMIDIITSFLIVI
jgi:hypothetical protein